MWGLEAHSGRRGFVARSRVPSSPPGPALLIGDARRARPTDGCPVAPVGTPGTSRRTPGGARAGRCSDGGLPSPILRQLLCPLVPAYYVFCFVSELP